MNTLINKRYLLILLVVFSANALSKGSKQRPPAKANIETIQQSETLILSWFNSALFRI